MDTSTIEKLRREVEELNACLERFESDVATTQIAFHIFLASLKDNLRQAVSLLETGQATRARTLLERQADVLDAIGRTQSGSGPPSGSPTLRSVE
jgi:hypothetical protein